MTLSAEINRLRTSLRECYRILGEKGITLPENQSMENLPNTISSAPSGDVSAINIYTLSFLQEVEKDIYESSFVQYSTIQKNILGIEETIGPLRDDWVFKPADMSERFRDILSSENWYVQNKFTEILGIS